MIRNSIRLFGLDEVPVLAEEKNNREQVQWHDLFRRTQAEV